MTPLPTTGLEGVRVLVVEDSLDVARVIERSLQKAGATVIVTATAADALAAARRDAPHVLVSDIGLPDATGIELLRDLREHAATRALPAIALTGETRREHVQNVLDGGFARCLAKPVSLADLVRAVLALVASTPP